MIALTIALGAAGFPLLILADIASRKRKIVLRIMAGILGTILIVGSYVLLWFLGPWLTVPLAVRVGGFVGTAVFLLLLVYSLLVEIPLVKAYLKDSGPMTLIETGTYSLCRHPGVLWLFGLLVCSFAAGGVVGHLYAALAWTFLDGVYSWLQERILYPTIFGDRYNEYMSRVPMIIPKFSGLCGRFSACGGTKRC